MASRGTIIFDFDGTIADSFDFVTLFLAQQAGRPSLSPKQRQLLEGLSMTDIARKLQIPTWRFLWLFIKGRRVMTKHMDKIEPFAEIEATLKTLHDRDYELCAVSSNRNKNIQIFLQQHGLAKYFSKTQGNASVFGKARSLRRMLEKSKLQPDKCFYVGDEVGDMQAAHSAHIRPIAVTWGYNDAITLAAEKPFALAKRPADLVNIFSSTEK